MAVDTLTLTQGFGSAGRGTCPYDLSRPRWLATTRRDLAGLAQRLEQAWTVSVDSPAESKDNGSTAGAEALVLMPSHLRPDWDLYLEFVYVIDLDRQTSAYNYVCHFRLDKLPDADLRVVDAAGQQILARSGPGAGRRFITTDAAVLPPIADGMSAEIEYAVLEPLPMPEITRLDDKTEALVSAMNNIHQFVQRGYHAGFAQLLCRKPPVSRAVPSASQHGLLLSGAAKTGQRPL